MSSPSPTARRAGPDLCPGVLSPWPAEDGGLARVRLPGGRLDPDGLRVLADAADELGNGVLELTSRANVQVRGVRPAGEHALAARLRSAGLMPSPAHDRVRNIVASPLSGLDLEGAPRRPDVGPLVAELDDGLCADEALAALPGRFLFAVDDGRLDVLDPPADVALVAREGGCLLVLGGAGHGLPAPAAAAVPAALAAARAFLDERAAQGSSAWRLAELGGGPARVAERVLAAVPAAGSAMEHVGRPATLPPAPGARRHRDGRICLVLGVPGGTLGVAAARSLAAHAAPEHGLRITPWRSVAIPGLTPDEAERAASELTAHGLVLAREGGRA